MDIHALALRIWDAEGIPGVEAILRERFPATAGARELLKQLRAGVVVGDLVWTYSDDQAAALIAAHDAKRDEDAADRVETAFRKMVALTDALEGVPAFVQLRNRQVAKLRAAITGKGE